MVNKISWIINASTYYSKNDKNTINSKLAHPHAFTDNIYPHFIMNHAVNMYMLLLWKKISEKLWIKEVNFLTRYFFIIIIED